MSGYTMVVAVGLMALALSGCATTEVLAKKHKQRPTGSLRVVTYNIALGKWLTTHSPQLRRLGRDHSVLAALRAHPQLRDFDLLAVQEVCSDRNGEQLAALARLAPYIAFERADPERDGECRKGQALISRYPIWATGRIDLPQLRRVGRSAMWADLVVPDSSGGMAPLRIYNLHLDNRGESLFAAEGRWEQMQQVLEHIAVWREEHPDEALLVVGDFNSLAYLAHPWLRERTIVEMQRRFDSAIPEYAPTHLLQYQLDWIFYERLQLQQATVVDLVRSDHYPVVAEFIVSPTLPHDVAEVTPEPH
ncbi:MAG: endonuclease/exonuclease/phosphatase family protein [Myxococcota bacterium]